MQLPTITYVMARRIQRPESRVPFQALSAGTLPATMEEPAAPAAFVVGESFARILTETTQSLVCVLAPDGRILLFNEACERATGFTREEVLGRARAGLRDPARGARRVRRVPRTTWRARARPRPQVGHWLAKDGGRRLIAWSNHPMTAADGTLESLVTTGIDLTDREAPTAQAEGALAGDPEAKLAEVGRLATEQRELRRVATLVASRGEPGARVHGRLGGLRAGARGQRHPPSSASRATAAR